MENINFKQRPSDLNTLAKRMHERSKKAGFWEEEYSNEHCLCLVISELMEAVEADRKGKRADLEMMNDEIIERNQQIRNILNCRVLVRPYVFQEAENESELDTFKKYFEYRVKDSIEDELADSIIRLLDLAGARDVGITIDKFTKTYSGSFTENIYNIMRAFIRPNGLGIKISVLIRDIEDLCLQMNIDLWLHVELKMKYNLGREYKHGKKY